MTELEYAVKTGRMKWQWDKGHAVDWDGVKVLECEPRLLEEKSHLDQKIKKSNMDIDQQKIVYLDLSSPFNRPITLPSPVTIYFCLQSQSADEDIRIKTSRMFSVEVFMLCYAQ